MEPVLASPTMPASNGEPLPLLDPELAPLDPPLPEPVLPPLEPFEPLPPELVLPPFDPDPDVLPPELDPDPELPDPEAEASPLSSPGFAPQPGTDDASHNAAAVSEQRLPLMDILEWRRINTSLVAFRTKARSSGRRRRRARDERVPDEVPRPRGAREPAPHRAKAVPARVTESFHRRRMSRGPHDAARLWFRVLGLRGTNARPVPAARQMFRHTIQTRRIDRRSGLAWIHEPASGLRSGRRSRAASRSPSRVLFLRIARRIRVTETRDRFPCFAHRVHFAIVFTVASAP